MEQRADRPYGDSIGRVGSRALRNDWMAAIATDDIRRNILNSAGHPSRPALDWHPVDVPGEWRSQPAFADHVGSVFYRRTFDAPELVADQRVFVRCDGVFDQADLWLDGAYVGDQDDYFLPHSYDITALSRLQSQHELVLEVDGKFHAGPWRDVFLDVTGPVAITTFHVLCRDASGERAHVLLGTTLDSDAPRQVVIRTTVDEAVLGERIHHLSRGVNSVNWTLDIARPELWWPWILGDQHLVDIGIEVVVDDEVSDSAKRRTGLREISADNWNVTVNGERVYAMGAHIDLAETDLGLLPTDHHEQNIRLAREAGLSLVRLHHHVAHPALYETADALGILLWQDVPPRPAGKRGRRLASRWASGLVNALGHHPSVAFWHHDALDRWTHTAMRSNDPTRTSLGHLSTTVAERALDDPRTGALRGVLAGAGADFPASIAVVPNLSRFPTHEQMQLLDPEVFLGKPSPTLLRRQIETLRLVKFRPSSGFCFPKLRDSSEMDNLGLVAWDGTPRPMYWATVDACRPIAVIADQLLSPVRGGDDIARHIYVVNDTAEFIDEATVTATVTTPTGTTTTAWCGSIPSGDVVRVGELSFSAPSISGTIVVDLVVEYGERSASNRYAVSIGE